MDGAADFLVGERDDHALDLPPMAEAQYIALVAAVLGTSRGLEPGVIAIGFEQQRGVREGCSAVNEWRVHGR